ncbi:MAG: hypothetical protein OMM_12831, partial [Candidatus Magnetoglobus multicellularis str. Araruama]
QASGGGGYRSGGGGRIAVIGYTQDQFTGTWGATGTLWRKSLDNQVAISITNGESLNITETGNSYSQIDLYNSSINFDLADNNVAITSTVRLQSNSNFTISSNTNATIHYLETTTNSNFRVSSDSNVTIDQANINGSKLYNSGIISIEEIYFKDSYLYNYGMMIIPDFNAENILTSTLYNYKTGSLEIVSNRVILGASVYLYKDGDIHGEGENLNTLDSMTLLSGSYLSHLQGNLSGLSFEIKNLLDVQSGGQINVTGRGYKGGHYNSEIGTSSMYGQTRGIDGIATTEGGATGRSGGSYGGTGASYSGGTNTIYGSMFYPTDLGSGGAVSTQSTGYYGGYGGGKVDIIAKDMNIDGGIYSYGSNGDSNYGGGGSGGSILLRLNGGKFSGTGRIQASGGGGYRSGGGGRIAVIGYTQDQFTGTWGATGTLWRKSLDNQVAISITNGESLNITETGNSYSQIDLYNSSINFDLADNNVAITSTVRLQSNSNFTISSNTNATIHYLETTTNSNFRVSSDSNV